MTPLVSMGERKAIVGKTDGVGVTGSVGVHLDAIKNLLMPRVLFLCARNLYPHTTRMHSTVLSILFLRL